MCAYREDMATQQVFIALQCCQCSTMQVRFWNESHISLFHPSLLSDSLVAFMVLLADQVKQQRRSSNKWVCALCNQKQSLRKVFDRGNLARDVRGFVQRFNMSRMTADGPGSVAPALIGDDLRASLPPVLSSGNDGYSRPRRTDWSEYLDPDDGESTADGLFLFRFSHPLFEFHCSLL